MISATYWCVRGIGTSRKVANPTRGNIEVTGSIMREKFKKLLNNYKDWQKQ